MRINAISPYRMAVAEVEGRDDLSKEPPGLLGCQPAFLDKVVKQFTSGDVL